MVKSEKSIWILISIEVKYLWTNLISRHLTQDAKPPHSDSFATPNQPTTFMGKSKRKQLGKKQLSHIRKPSDPFARAKVQKSVYASAGVGGNRFDIKDNRTQKNIVLGQKVKGRSRDVARARTLRREDQESTLRPAIRNADKVNTFKDSRLGEGDDSIDQDERDLQRFIKVQKDRFRTTGKTGSKSSKFNLESTESSSSGGLTLTHGGRALDDLDFSGHQGLDEDEDDQLGGRIVERLHFGGGAAGSGGAARSGGDESGDVNKSREDIYKELIAKSKMYKAERQKQKRVDEEEQDLLDGELENLRSMLDFRPKKTKKETELEAMLQRAGLNKDGNAMEGSQESDDEDGKRGEKRGLTHKERRQGLGGLGNDDEFDIMARSLLFEARAQASDRTKTPEERAKDELEEMKEMEEKRKKRARGDYDHDEEGGEGGDEGGDDLGGNFAVDKAFEHPDMTAGDELSGDDEEMNEEMTGDMSVDDLEDDGEMPYVVDCPRNVQELSRMLSKWTQDEDEDEDEDEEEEEEDKKKKRKKKKKERGTAEMLVGRIMKNHSVHLPSAGKVTNRDKMSKLYHILLDYVVEEMDYAVTPLSRSSSILSSLWLLGKEVSSAAGEAYRTRLQKMRTECILGLDEEGDFVGRRWCTAGEIVFLRSIPLLFPTTDFRHPVVSPTIILLGSFLSGIVPVRSVRDIAVAMSLSEIQLNMVQKSGRLAIEAINMTSALLASFTSVIVGPTPITKKKRFDAGRYSSSKQEAIDRVLCLKGEQGRIVWLRAVFERDNEEKAEQEEEEAEQEEEEENREVPSSSKQRLPSVLFRTGNLRSTSPTALLCSLLSLCERIVTQYGRNVALPELLGPMIPLLSAFDVKKKRRRNLSNVRRIGTAGGTKLEQLFTSLRNDVKDRLKLFLTNRQPLRLQSQQKIAIPLRQQRPMFDENYIVKKDNDPDRERAELKSLKRKLKREEKALARDVRKDSLFVAQEQDKVRTEWEEDVKKKYNNFVEFVNQQHAQAKEVQREGVAHGGGMKSGRRFKRARHSSGHSSKK